MSVLLRRRQRSDRLPRQRVFTHIQKKQGSTQQTERKREKRPEKIMVGDTKVKKDGSDLFPELLPTSNEPDKCHPAGPRCTALQRVKIEEVLEPGGENRALTYAGLMSFVSFSLFKQRSSGAQSQRGPSAPSSLTPRQTESPNPCRLGETDFKSLCAR